MSSFFNKNKSIEGTKVEYLPEEGIVRFERDDEVKAFANKEVLEEFSKHNEMPIFKGSIENGYESDFLGYKDKCPLCNTPTQQMYSNFIWTNQLKSRILSAPVGYFCPNCPTVIIDDELVKKSIDKKRFQYWGTVAIETGYSDKKDDVILFKTFNGIKPTYILDQEGGLDGILNSVHQPSDQTFLEHNKENFPFIEQLNKESFSLLQQTNTAKDKNLKAKKKKKNNQAKQSRKANRKK